jgi:biopolymer transport protein ExbD
MARRRNRRRHRRTVKGVELNMAAMLDMAFQLLAFFILTFRPSPIEGQLALNLPPAVPLTKVDQPTAETAEAAGSFGLETALLYVIANDQGEVAQLKLETDVIAEGPLDAAKLGQLNERLKTLFSTPGSPLENIQITVDGRLMYDSLMRIIDVCLQQRLPNGEPLKNLSFVELQANDAD